MTKELLDEIIAVLNAAESGFCAFPITPALYVAHVKPLLGDRELHAAEVAGLKEQGANLQETLNELEVTLSDEESAHQETLTLLDIIKEENEQLKNEIKAWKEEAEEHVSEDPYTGVDEYGG